MVSELRDRLAGKLRHFVNSPLEKGGRAARIVAIASNKGGVGKTTTAVNLASAFAQRGVRVLLMDLDPQAHVAASLKLDAAEHFGRLGDVLLGRKRDVYEAVAPTGINNLDVAGSDKNLGETEQVLAAKIGKELLLDDALAVARTHYDLIMIDCPPNMGTLTLNALCAADHLLVPSDMSVLALEGVADIIATVRTLQTRLNRRVELCGIVATRYDKRATHMNDAIAGSFVDLYGDKLLTTKIPQTSALNKAHLAGQSIFDFAPTSVGAQSYENLAGELAPVFGLQAFVQRFDA